VGADDLEAHALDLLQRLTPLHEGRQHEVAERAVLEQERAEASRSTATYRNGSVTTAVTKTV
jgi:hypothetical protein